MDLRIATLLVRLFMLLSMAVAMPSSFAQNSAPLVNGDIQVIRSILEQPDDQIDLATVMATVDHLIDPMSDTSRSLAQIDQMVSEIKSRLPLNARSGDKLDALREYIYKAGPWNGYKPFQYDLDDPLGQNIHNKLLSHYLISHKGNCVSMPLLFVILGQRIGLDVTASTAPEHLFVKYRDDAGVLYNIEATSGGGFARDVWMRHESPSMTDRAIANGIYMQPLTKKETVVLMADILEESYGQQKMENERLGLGYVELMYYPKYVPAMLHISSAFYRLHQRNFVDKYPSPEDIPMAERATVLQLEKDMVRWQDKARGLGWRMPEDSDKVEYLQRVEQIKSTQQQ